MSFIQKKKSKIKVSTKTIYLIIPVGGGLSFPLSSIFLFNAKDVSQKVNFQFNFLDTKRLERFDVEEQENREEGLPDNN